MLRRLFTFFLIVLFGPLSLFATHNRAGEITYRQLNQTTYEIKIVTYTKINSPADRPELPVSWGDNKGDTLIRNSEVPVAADIKRNTYTGVHTYPGPGNYIISFEDPNRNANVVNIPNSVSIPFYVETLLIINPFVPNNNSPILLQPPIDQACVNRVFIHNPNAYDPDGDSLSYTLIFCRGENGAFIPNYSYPTASNFFTLNPITGDLIWDSPQLQGEYNVAIRIDEWRNGSKIGFVVRDMQINVIACNNFPPEIVPIPDFCVEAGQSINFSVTANDPDNNQITLTATGAPFLLSNPAVFVQPTIGQGSVTVPFSWTTQCSNVRKQPYQVIFKAEDNSLPVNLVDLETALITVVGPSPKNPGITPLGGSMQINWDASTCTQAVGYRLYRRNGASGWNPAQCETGVPAYTGFKLIQTLNGLNSTNFTDDDNGAGLLPGILYCYRVIAFYPDGAESYASVEFCARLIKDLPVMTNASVNITDASNGEMFVQWSKPNEFDTLAYPGPYRYVLQRAAGINGNTFTPIATFNSLNDTNFVDTSLNTISGGYNYKVEFHNDTPGNTLLVGTSQPASSVFLTVASGDKKNRLNWAFNVTWDNAYDSAHYYVIYRKNLITGIFDSIAASATNNYTDNGLINGQEYCYYIKALGRYTAPGFLEPLINLSQQTCATPMDNEPPCAPVLSINSDCVAAENVLTWFNPDPLCASDIDHYNIYYAAESGMPLTLLLSISNANDTFYVASNLFSVAGCYAVSAVDSTGNESTGGIAVCVENCPLYELPNVFTPNGDNVNDVFHPLPYRFVKDIDLEIFNRWGQVVFKTDDPNINWDGKHQTSNTEVPSAVYFYRCKVNEIYLDGVRSRDLTGFIHLIR